jgi:transcriptional regulator with GAF, ATPase, and Fis domain
MRNAQCTTLVSAARKPQVQHRATWFRACQCRESFEGEIRAALAASGIPVDTDALGPYGVICFEKVDEQLFAALHEVRCDPRRRVLAVAASSFVVDTGLIWRLLHAGASDVLLWSGQGAGATQLAAKFQRWFEIDELAEQTMAQESLIGDSPAWLAVIRKVIEAARFSAIPILVTGESGTGKELLAKLISAVCASASSANKLRKELITVDCASLVPELSGSEFFGHERGAFTGAHIQREGAFAMADGATLLLDEIGEVPLGLQAQLLRAIQEKTYKRVGGNVWQKTNFRLVCATNRDLEDAVHRGQFRLDLYYRICGCVVRTPALTDRKDDILPLARHFLNDYFPGKAPEFDTAVSEYLVKHTYAGNVRQLRQLIARIAHRHAGPGPITAGDIPDDDRPPALDDETYQSSQPAWPDEDFERSIANALATGACLKDITRTAAETAIRIAVQSEGSNLQKAASRLGITDRALQMRRATGRLRGQPQENE